MKGSWRRFRGAGWRASSRAARARGNRGEPMALRKLVAGNWKMHGLSADLAEVEAIADAARRLSGVSTSPCACRRS